MTVAYIYSEKPAAAAELVALAKSIDAESVLIAVNAIGDDMRGAGSDRAIVLKGDSERPEAYAKPIADMMEGVGNALFLAASTVSGRELAASVAGILGCAMVSDISAMENVPDGISAQRTVFGGAVVNTVEASFPCVATVGAGVCEPSALPATDDVEQINVAADTRVARKALKPLVTDDVDLAKANAVVCVGMGIDGAQDVEMAQQLANVLHGAVGCTRDVAEGMKLLPKERYIGITGAIVSPAIYLSLGVSGQLQHVYGIRDAKVIVAVDQNKDAPIFRSADYGIVGDLHDIAPKLIEALGA